jgi:PadR family transcriptional regulator, regulatory protein AphA
MSLTHAILGLLQWEPMTGYDLKTQRFDQSIAHFWPADQAQIYRTLDKMAEEGWVRSSIEVQDGRPNRKVYHLLPAGEAELKRWLLTDQPLSVYREAFLVQVFFAQELPNAVIIRLMEVQLRLHRERLAAYESIDPLSMDDLRGNRAMSLQRMPLELGIRIEQTKIAWLEAFIERVRHLPDA